jgi:hypothetical protein
MFVSSHFRPFAKADVALALIGYTITKDALELSIFWLKGSKIGLNGAKVALVRGKNGRMAQQSG